MNIDISKTELPSHDESETLSSLGNTWTWGRGGHINLGSKHTWIEIPSLSLTD